MDKAKLNKKQLSEIFGTGFKYPVKFDIDGKKGLSFTDFYMGLTAKQRPLTIKEKTEKITQLSSDKIAGLITKICIEDQKYLPYIVKSDSEKVKFLDSMKTTYKDIFTDLIIKKLKLNMNPNKNTSEIVKLDIDTCNVGELITANCSLFNKKPVK